MSKIATHELRDPALIFAWRDAAVADGWTITPTYENESVDTAFHLAHANGFKISGCARPDTKSYPPRPVQPSGGYYTLAGWDDRGIGFDPFPAVYSLAALVALTRHCPICGADDVDTNRVGFADRACATCTPGLRAKIETPGWCD